MRRGFELGFQEIAAAILAVVFIVVLVLIIMAIVNPGGSSIEIFGRRAEGLIG